MAGSIYVVGLKELEAGLASEGFLAEARGSAAVAKTAVKVERTAKQLAPVGATGELQRSIETTRSKTRAEIGPTARYGGFMEFGTYKDVPQPYMGPALDQHEGDLVDELTKLVGEL